MCMLFYSSTVTEPLQFGVLPNTTAISPEELARDFYVLNTLVGSSTKVSHFVAGPDISRPLSGNPSPAEYLQRYGTMVV